MKLVPLLILDIDGTVRHGKGELGHFVNGPEDVVIFPEAMTLMRRWKDAGGRIVGVTNQGGIALGLVPEVDVKAAILRMIDLTEGLIDLITFCGHHPDAPKPGNRSCWCRKPKPGMVYFATIYLQHHNGYQERYPPDLALMVGDRPEDRECAQNAGVAFLDAVEWRAKAHA
jgi:D-glycero-D-manno-heptose 1,7-bisphosphate phosphatase